MKKTVLILMIGWITVQLQAQNYIGLQVGFLGTHTSIAEYERIERNDYLLDSVTLSQNVGSVQVALNTEKQSALACVSQLVEWRSPKPKVAGSIPVMRANCLFSSVDRVTAS